MNINASLFVQFVIFFILAWFTMKVVWPPLMKALDERAKKIADGLAAAEKGSLSLKNAEKQISEQLTQVQQQARERLHEAEKQAQAMIEAAKNKALEESSQIIRAAQAEASMQVAAAKAALRDEVAALAMEGAKQILQREINPAVHAEILGGLKQRLV